MREPRKIAARLRDAFAETFWPTRCLGCDAPGTLLCDECVSKLPLIDISLACPRCGAPFGFITCTECPQPGSLDHEGRLIPAAHSFSAARAACEHRGSARRIMLGYKDGFERRLARGIARALCATVRGRAQNAPAPEDWSIWADALVYIPPTPAALRRRGFDHMGDIARICANELTLPLICPLVAHASFDQRELGAEERFENRREAFGYCETVNLPPHILVIDDVLTTGATTSAASSVLLAHGAEEVRVAVFTRVW